MAPRQSRLDRVASSTWEDGDQNWSLDHLCQLRAVESLDVQWVVVARKMMYVTVAEKTAMAFLTDEAQRNFLRETFSVVDFVTARSRAEARGLSVTAAAWVVGSSVLNYKVWESILLLTEDALKLTTRMGSCTVKRESTTASGTWSLLVDLKMGRNMDNALKWWTTMADSCLAVWIPMVCGTVMA